MQDPSSNALLKKRKKIRRERNKKRQELASVKNNFPFSSLRNVL